MGAKLEEKVLRSIAQIRERSGRFLLNFADQTARELTAYLAELPGIEAVTPAGSLRRGRETIGDLDLLVTGPNAAAALDRIAAHPRVHEVLGRGVNKTSVKFGREGLQVDVRALEHASFGAAMQYFTGSKEHNVALRQRAIRMGFKLSEYGLFRAEDDVRVAGETEEEVYKTLGLDWIPPELRENNGEIELAEAHALPKLVEQRDIRGDLHMHTTATDGRATLEEMAEAARALGYEYVAITDHSKAIAMAFGLDEKRVVEFAQTVRRDQRIRQPRDPHSLRPRMRHHEGRRDGYRLGCAGGARYRDRQRPQPHVPRAGGDDRSFAARARMPAPESARTSDGTPACCIAIRSPSISIA